MFSDEMNMVPPIRVERIYLVFKDETFMLDRQEGNLEYAKRRTPKHFFYHLYQNPAGVTKLMDFFEQEVQWEEGGEGPYELTVTFSDQTKRMIRNVPAGWERFLEQAKDFMKQQDDGILL